MAGALLAIDRARTLLVYGSRTRIACILEPLDRLGAAMPPPLRS